MTRTTVPRRSTPGSILLYGVVHCTVLYIVRCPADLNQSFLCAEASADLSKACIVVEWIVLILLVFLFNDSTTEDLLCFAPARSETCSLFCLQFLGLDLE